MPTYNAQYRWGAGVQYLLASGDTYLHAQHIVVNAINSDAVRATGGGNSFEVSGFLIGYCDALQRGDSSSDFGNKATIGPTGSLVGQTGINSFGGEASIDNGGTINATLSGAVFNSNSGQGSEFRNSGSIYSYEIGVFHLGTEGLLFRNSGSVEAKRDYAYQGSAGVDSIINSGSIKGNLTANAGVVIDLGDGADRYNGTGGTANGFVNGGIGSDVLIGGSGIDKLNGGADADSLYGRLGKDVLTGGDKGDRFYFDTAPSTMTNRDTITDFETGEDLIYLKKSIFAALAQGTGIKLLSGFYWESADGLAHDSSDRIIVNTTTGVINYDSNGNVAGGIQQQIALLSGNVPIDYTDFFVY